MVSCTAEKKVVGSGISCRSGGRLEKVLRSIVNWIEVRGNRQNETLGINVGTTYYHRNDDVE